MYRPAFAKLVFASLAIVLASCATTGNRPIPLQITIAVANDANPDEAGRPSPVVVDIFDLARTERFRDADYLALLSAPERKLRGDVLDQHRLTAIAPGSQRVLTLTADAKTEFIGVIAELVQYSDTKTRLALPLKPGNATTLKLIVNANGIKNSDETRPSFLPRDRFNED